MKKKFKLISVIICISIFLSISFVPVKANNILDNIQSVNIQNVTLSAYSSYALVDVNTGRLLWGHNENNRRPMASTTKIMTALVAIENANLTDIVEVSKTASGIEGSSIWLSVGEKHTLEDLLYGLMLRSGNDAAAAIAEYVGGSIDGFAQMMNNKAKQIGALNSSFKNPHGLDAEGHYTTAYDLALISAVALSNETFKKIASTKYKTIPWEQSQYNRSLKNKNKLLWSYEGATGVKTGYTKKSGRCLVASAKRNQTSLVAVAMNCGPMFESSSSMLDYGFDNYSNIDIVYEGEFVKKIPVENSKNLVNIITNSSFKLLVYNDIINDKKNINEILDNLGITKQISIDNINAPIIKNQITGILTFSSNNRVIKQINLISENEVKEKKTIFKIIIQLIKQFFN